MPINLERKQFSKDERLCNKRIIQELFNEGSSFFVHPFQVRHLPVEDFNCHKVLISVPKRKFKRAVDRHWISRRIREAYRLNKHLIYEQKPTDVPYAAIGLIYVGKKKEPYQRIENKLKSCLARLYNPA